MRTPSVTGVSEKILERVSTNLSCGGDNLIERFKLSSPYKNSFMSTGDLSQTPKVSSVTSSLGSLDVNSDI